QTTGALGAAVGESGCAAGQGAAASLDSGHCEEGALMAFATKAVANRLVVILSGLTGLANAQLGVPESTGPRINAYVTMASQTVAPRASAVMQRQARYLVVFAYRLDGAEATAESTLMDL